ncbi:hypothetical protein JQC72_00340 [Polycladomyces sp. WAk]|uniref:Uncharacterized protein n=1 Tax=Polycladomyces zharkentensis TaxID=2807616 RepID=A0ABS2WEQ3_9BACL|nr:hypothetical protein [Polycladomyces sp. WAk]MBN2907969.1 hypothetical protein [Polycladomyces sp. WAk]
MKLKKWSIAVVLMCTVSLAGTPLSTEASPTPRPSPGPSPTPPEDRPKQSKLFKVGPTIPGVKKYGWVPQGLGYLKSKNWILISNYWDEGKGSQGHPSTISVVDRKTGKFVKNVYLYEKKGNKHTGHVGGITVTPHYLWVASTTGGKNYLLQYPLNQLVNKKDDQPIYPKKIYNLKHGVSYVTYHFKYEGNRTNPVKQLCIGKFEDKKAGSLYCHNLDSKENMSSKYVSYQTPSNVQGVEFYGKDVNNRGYILYSRSFGRKKNSTLDVYKGLGTTNKVKSLKMYSMAEEIVQVGNQLYVNYESGAKKYRRGGIKKTYHLYYADIRKIVKN